MRWPAALSLVLLLVAGAIWRLPPASRHAAAAPTGPELTHYVDPFIGTAGDGNVFPGATAPFGMVQWSPDTSAGGLTKPAGYNPGDLIIRGFSPLHLSGAGCVSFENVPIMPTTRPVTAPMQANGSPYSDRFVSATQHAAPGYYAVTLKSHIDVQLSVTARTGFARFGFPRAAHQTILFPTGNAAGPRTNVDGAEAAVTRVGGSTEVDGWASAGRFCGLNNHFTVYFAARFNRPFLHFGTWTNAGVQRNRRRATGSQSGAYVDFGPARGRAIEMKLGISYVSVDGARANLAAEDRSWKFDSYREREDTAWNGVLQRIRVSGPTSELRTFYTALYHSFVQPSTFSDADGHYRGFDNRLHHLPAGHVQYANFSGWDIYRSEMQLIAWLSPNRASDMVISLLNDAEQGGWLPRWPVANDYTGEMDGDSADPIIADAAAFGARAFPARAALQWMVKGATRLPTRPGSYVERPGLGEYMREGWVVPQTGGWGPAAEALEYATDDFAVAQIAKFAGDRNMYRIFTHRSANWRNLYNPTTRLLQARYTDGSFVPLTGPYGADQYVEGNASQYLWLVPQNLPSLITLLGGAHAAIHRLDALFGRLGNGPYQPYDWPGNEPSLAIPWVYDFAGRRDRTQQVVRNIVTTKYTSALDGLPGNDDLGALSSWYVWASLGIYPEVPGIAGFALGSPLFARATIAPPHSAPTTIVARAAAPRHAVYSTAEVNGRRLSSSWVMLSALRGKTLTFR